MAWSQRAIALCKTSPLRRTSQSLEKSNWLRVRVRVSSIPLEKSDGLRVRVRVSSIPLDKSDWLRVRVVLFRWDKSDWLRVRVRVSSSGLVHKSVSTSFSSARCGKLPSSR